MKKIFFVATLAVALVCAGCNGNSSKKSDKDVEKKENAEKILPKELSKKIKEADKELKEQLEDNDEMTYEGYAVEDNNIVFSLQINKDELNGKSLKAQMKKSGLSEKQFQELMSSQMLANFDEDDLELFELLKEHKYNIVFRMIGKDADDTIDIKISYKDLPDEMPDDDYGYYNDEDEYESAVSASELAELENLVCELERAADRNDVDAAERVIEQMDMLMSNNYDLNLSSGQQARAIRAVEKLGLE